MNARVYACRTPVCALVALASPGRAEAAPNEFYAGKTISIITSGGGAYEAYGRVFARHMPKYIPGHPTMIVQAMPGAGGARAASYLYKAATRDGTFIGGIHGAVLTAPFLDRKSTRLNSSHLGISYAVFCLKKKIDTVRHDH